MSRHAIATERAPAAIGPYSQAVRSGVHVYTSGQIPLDPATGALVDGDIATQARRVFDNLQAVCAAADSSFADVVRVGILSGRSSRFRGSECGDGGLFRGAISGTFNGRSGLVAEGRAGRDRPGARARLSAPSPASCQHPRVAPRRQLLHSRAVTRCYRCSMELVRRSRASSPSAA